MNIRLAVGSALMVFILSVAVIIALGMAGPGPAKAVDSGTLDVSAPQVDLSMAKRNVLSGPISNLTYVPEQNSTGQNATEQNETGQNSTDQTAPAPAENVSSQNVSSPPPVVAPAPIQNTTTTTIRYHRRTRAS